MQIELRCPRCPCRFSAPPDLPADEVIDRMIDEGTWFALAKGETFEDMIFAALVARGKIRCPECSKAVAIHEESLGRLTRERFACR
jgi:transposase-like protein